MTNEPDRSPCLAPLSPTQFVAWLMAIRDVPGRVSLSVQVVAHVHVAALPPGALRISVGPDLMEEQLMVTLPPHKTFSTRKTPLTFQPTCLKPVEGGDPAPAPDTDAVITLTSSDSSVGVEQNPETGQWYITTPAESGEAVITITALSPNADYESIELPYSYGPPVPGQINVTIGMDIPDA